MALNRKIAPKIELSSSFSFLKAESEILRNGVPFHFINYSEQEILKLQLSFKAGTIFQQQNLVASTACNLLTEGTKQRSSKEIAHLIESQGTFIETECTAENASITIYCLLNQLEKVLPILIEIIEEANFDQKEVEDYLNIRRQKFNINSQKVGFISRNEFSELIFGMGHPYSNKVVASDFDSINRDHLLTFFQTYYKKGMLEVYASGKVNDQVKKLINDYLGGLDRTESSVKLPSFSSAQSEQQNIRINKEDALQTAIRIGKQTILKSDADFPDLYFTNVILGGYFGSRLMSNLRENKGYTYGVHSGLMSYKKGAYFFISTEVGSEVAPDAVHQIKKELNRMISAPVAAEELKLVKNYLMGSIQRSFDGAFAAMDRFKSIQTIGLDYRYYYHLIDRIESITSDKIQAIAEKYLQVDSMKTILAGKLY